MTSIRPACGGSSSAELLVDPYVVPFEAMTLWDVLEHIPDFQALLANVREWLFVSLPIFRDAEHVLRIQAFQAGQSIVGISPATGWCSRWRSAVSCW